MIPVRWHFVAKANQRWYDADQVETPLVAISRVAAGPPFLRISPKAEQLMSLVGAMETQLAAADLLTALVGDLTA